MATRTLTYVLLGKDSLSPAFKKAGAEGEAASEGIAGGMSKAGFAGIAVAGIIAGVLTKSLKDARSEGWSPLAVAAKDAGVSFDAFKPKAEAAGTAMAKLGFSQGDVNASLKVLLTSTRNSQLSLNSLGGAADFARFKGIGLSDAATMLAKAATGSTRALKDVGISTSDLPKHFATTGTAADRMRVIMELLNQRIGGSAAAAATTFGGKLEVMHAQLENVSAKIGTALLPILSSLLTMVSAKILPAITAFSDWFEKVGSPAIANFATKLTPIVTMIMGDFFTGISTIVKAVTMLPAPFKIAALAVTALGVAMKLAALANPWVLLAVAIVTLVGLVVTHWNTIKAVTLEVWGVVHSYITGVITDVINFIHGIFNPFITWWQTNNAAVIQIWRVTWNLIWTILKPILGIIAVGIKTWWTLITLEFQVAMLVISTAWKIFWNVLGNVAKVLWAYIQAVVKIGWDVLVGLFTVAIDLLTGRWGAAWTALRNTAVQVMNAINAFIRSAMGAFQNIISSTLSTVVNFFGQLGGRVLNAVRSFGSLLIGIGRDLIGGLFSGITGALSSVGSWVKTNIFNPIVGAIKSLFGIHSPSTVMAEMGGHLVGGLILGLLRSNPSAMIGKIFGSLPNALGALIGKGLVDIEHLPAKALSALGGVAKSIGGFFAKLVGGGGGGVGQWMSVVLEALALNGLPSSLASQVLRQISSESGGNPNAINLTDSNAAAGDPSRGLLQTIGSTFSAYHIAGTSSNIYDPLANVAAAINYAKHVYGPGLMSGGNGLGSGHGYALGTNSARAGWAWVGERGPELMKFRGGEQVIPNNRIGTGNGGTHVTWTGNVIVQGHALASKQQLARTVTEAIEYSQRHGNK